MKKVVVFSRLGLMFAFFALCVLGSVSDASANILITPTRIVFEDGQRFSIVTLVNNGKETKSYEIDWVYLEMIEGNGGYARDRVLPADMADISELVVFSPRRVTLAPGSKQKIRLAFRRPAGIEEGDYHIHLRFKVLPEDHTRASVVKSLEPQKASVNVNINLSYTIPVLVRIGEGQPSVSIEQISMGRNDRGQLTVTVPVRRGGDYSVLGYLRLYHVGADGGRELVGEISNANIFREISVRNFTLPLFKEVSGGMLEIELRDGGDRNGDIYANRIFPLQ